MFVFIQKGVFQKVRSLRRGREGVIEKQTKTNRGTEGGGVLAWVYVRFF